MCLGVPGKIVEVRDLVARVDFWGVCREVALHVVDEPVTIGDYVLVHVGFAIRRIAPEDVATTLEFYRTLIEDEFEPSAPRSVES